MWRCRPTGAGGLAVRRVQGEARDAWIGWVPEQQFRRLRLVANNTRFLILPAARAPNLASRVLALSARRLSSDMEAALGHGAAGGDVLREVARPVGGARAAEAVFALPLAPGALEALRVGRAGDAAAQPARLPAAGAGVPAAARLDARGHEPLSFEAAIDAEAERLAGCDVRLRQAPHYYCYNHHHFSYLDRGRYGHYLSRWLAHFPAKQLLVLSAEALFANPNRVANDTFAFLGLPPHEIGPSAHNQRRYPGLPAVVRARITRHLEDDKELLATVLRRVPGSTLSLATTPWAVPRHHGCACRGPSARCVTASVQYNMLIDNDLFYRVVNLGYM